MSQPSPETPSESSPKPARSPSKSWPMWLGIGFFGLAGLALLISLVNVVGSNVESAATPESPTADTETAATEPPNDLRAQQALASEVVEALGRDVLVGDSPTRGNPDADIVMLEFSDFQCPYCSRAVNEVDAFMAAHEEEVLLVFKHFPLTSIHPEAVPAAMASWAAGQQGKFWEFHTALFENQAELGSDLYGQIAAELDLDLEQFNRDRDSEAAKVAIARDLALAQEFQLNSTPTFIMDDLLIPGAVPSDFFAEAFVRLQAAQK